MVTAAARKLDTEPVEYGPAMLALNERQREFVIAFVMGGVGTKAVRLAGYGNPKWTKDHYARAAYQLRQRDSVRAAIAEESHRWLRSGEPVAVAFYYRILADPKAKNADKLRAADAIMARCDPITTNQLIAVQHEHHHRHTLSANEIIARIAALAPQVGVDLKALPPTIDATAVEVSP
jgi:phage terminase small subunit